MYPRLSDLFQDLFGINLPLPIYSFGFMVAMAVMLAAWIAQKDLDRRYAEGSISGIRQPVKGSRKSTQEVSPSHLMGTITILAVVGGFAGAKLFHILENLDAFLLNPGRMLFSSGGFTFYGGLIVGSVLIVRYVRKQGVSALVFADALAPGLMLAYGIGRIGCHLAGDGDWGIASNLANKPAWLPTWLWAETYPNNILGIDLSAQPVYPTSIYEFVMASALAGVLWALRRHPFRAGWLISLYLALNGIERFVIEKIRVNNTFDVFGIESTQAETIAVVLFAAGVIGLVKTSRRAAASK